MNTAQLGNTVQLFHWQGHRAMLRLMYLKSAHMISLNRALKLNRPDWHKLLLVCTVRRTVVVAGSLGQQLCAHVCLKHSHPCVVSLFFFVVETKVLLLARATSLPHCFRSPYQVCRCCSYCGRLAAGMVVGGCEAAVTYPYARFILPCFTNLPLGSFNGLVV